MTDLSTLPTSLAGATGSGVLHSGLGGGGAALHLSSALLASRLSSAEHQYLAAGVAENMRTDGRARLDYRPFTVETGVVPHANGSARLRLGAASDVLVAVNLSMAVPEASANSAQGSVACSVEHSAACAVDLDERAVQAANSHLTASVSTTNRRQQRGGCGQTSTAVRAMRDAIRVHANVQSAQCRYVCVCVSLHADCCCPSISELQRVLSESGALPLRSLVIIPDKQVWLVNIDVLVMDNGGNLLDAIVMAVKAAMLTTTYEHARIWLAAVIGSCSPQPAAVRPQAAAESIVHRASVRIACYLCVCAAL